MSNFEWQTAESMDWDNPPAPPPPHDPRPWANRRWLGLALLVILVISTAVYTGYHTIQRQIETREAAIRTDIQNSLRVWQQAGENRDVEILNTILSGSDARWSSQQQLLTEQGLLWARPFNGWAQQPPTDPDQLQITLSPTLNEAELTLTQTYQLNNSHPIDLQHHLVFRQGNNRWLYAPPQPNFWGTEQQVSGRYLTTFYPSRDEAEAVALHEFVDRYIGIYCAQAAELCSDSQNLTLRLETNPSTLPHIFNIYLATFWTTTRYQAIELPTLSLVGQPTDETSRDALFQQYAASVLAGINRRLLIHGRVGQEPFDRVLLNQQLAALGLPHEQFHDTDLPLYDTLGEYEMLWSVASLPLEETYSPHAAQLITFLQEIAPQTSPLTMQSKLGGGSFAHWLEDVTGQPMADLERSWLRYVLDQQETQAPPDPTLLPNQLLKLLCTAEERTLLVDYNPQKDRWLSRQTLGLHSRFGYALHALPDDSGYILETRPHSEGELWSMALVRPQVDQIILQANNQTQSLSYAGTAHPHGRELLIQSSHPDFGLNEFQLLNLDTCDKDDCPLTPLAGWPYWSPSGGQLMLLTFDGLYLGENRTGTPSQRIGRGFAPFWVDDETYGFVRTTRLTSPNGLLTSELDLVLGQLDTGRKVVRTLPELWANLAEEPLTAPADTLLFATTNPHRDALVYLVVQGSGSDVYYVLTYAPMGEEAEEEETTAVLATLPAPPTQLQFSPNGRWLSLTTHPPQPTPNGQHQFITLHLFDLRRDHTYRWTISLPPEIEPTQWQPDWSADSRWLLLNGREYLHLVQPSTGYEWRTIHDYNSCHSAQWLNLAGQ